MEAFPRRDVPTLLVVDDQAANIRVIAAALGNAYEVRFATSGTAAVEAVRSGGIDLVLLDVMLPDIDGFEVCRLLKSNEATSRVPVIFVTAREDVHDETRGFDVGGVDYITKPISPPIVRARVRTHLELKKSRDLLERLASIDPLTGIANRRRFDQLLKSEWHRSSRAGKDLTVAILDLDFFKSYNDTYGHARGDDCLRTIGELLSRSAKRPGDFVARYGGEEFAIVLSETDGQGAIGFFQQVVRDLESRAIEHAASECSDHVTFSAGVITLVPQRDIEPEAVLLQADQLLYEAKAAGRNRFLVRNFDWAVEPSGAQG